VVGRRIPEWRIQTRLQQLIWRRLLTRQFSEQGRSRPPPINSFYQRQTARVGQGGFSGGTFFEWFVKTLRNDQKGQPAPANSRMPELHINRRRTQEG